MPKQTTQPEEQSKAPGTWGESITGYLFGLKDKPVKVVLMDGKAYAGVLVGVGPFDLLLRQQSGLTLLVCKHAVAYLHPASNGESKA